MSKFRSKLTKTLLLGGAIFVIERIADALEQKQTEMELDERDEQLRKEMRQEMNDRLAEIKKEQEEA